MDNPQLGRWRRLKCTFSGESRSLSILWLGFGTSKHARMTRPQPTIAMLTAREPHTFPPERKEVINSPDGITGSRGKLAPPQFAFEAVLSRPAEVLLRNAMYARLVTVCAPPGYGKTVILNRLHHTLVQRGQRCVWITLDDRDVAVSSILYLIQQALAAAGALPPAYSSDTAPAGDDPRSGIERLHHLLERITSPITLFIDNLSFCVDPLLSPLLERLIFGGAPHVRLVLSGTGRLPIDSTRAKLELGAVELLASQLAFDAESTTRLLHMANVAHDQATVARVQELTEGWPAAVRLVQILMAEAGESGPVLARFSGTDSDVADVLTRRVLARFDPELATFLVEVALLREFSADLSEHVTGRKEAAGWIRELLDRNVLVFPLDRTQHWLRMHTLLRQYLLAEGQRRLPRERRREILERAAQWHADQGDDIAALEAALEAPSPVLAARLLDRVARVVAGSQGRLSLYIRWVEQLLASGVTLSLEAHTWYVWSLCFTLQYEHAHRAMDALDHRLAEADPQGHLKGLHARLGLLRAVVSTYLDMMEAARVEAHRWLQDSAHRDPLAIATVASAAATAELSQENLPAARTYVNLARAAITRSTSSYGQAWVSLVEACVELVEGEPLLADRRLTQARPAAASALGEDASIVATIDFVHAYALLELGRTESAQRKASAGLARAAFHGITETTLHGFAACVGLWDGSDQHPFGPDALDAIVRSYPPRAQRALSALQARRLLALGRVQDAQTLSRRQLLHLQVRPGSSPPLTERLLTLELQAAAGDGRKVLEDAERRARAPETTVREAIQLHLIAAGLQVQAGQDRLALRELTLAISKAARRRMLLPFLERQALVLQILTGTPDKALGLAQPDEIAMLAQLRERLLPSPSPAEPVAVQVPASAPVEALTSREVQLLELLGLGLSNQQIADRTSLSLATVKWHFYNLFGKLQVRNRSAALARARALQLIR